MFNQLLEGATYGSRVAAVTTASELFGDARATSSASAPTDSLVVVADLVEKAGGRAHAHG